MTYYIHLGNKRTYVKDDELNKFNVKQNEGNQWEKAIFYTDVETGENYITGENRFNRKFIKANDPVLNAQTQLNLN